MKKVFYDEGPLAVTAGIAGQFQLGVPKEVEDDVADLLLKKPMWKEFTDLPATFGAPTISKNKQSTGKE